MRQTVIDTAHGRMIRCAACKQHCIPKDRWRFNGDVVNPTFTPSVNESVNQPSMKDYQPGVASSRCHFSICTGIIEYHRDCSHSLAGQKLPLQPFSDAEVKMYAAGGGA